MEKLLVLCKLFHTDLDTLLRGEVQEHMRSDTIGYDRFMNWFSNWVALGVGLIILSVAAGLGCRGWLGAPEIAVPAVLLSGVAVAVAILIVAGMRYDRFEKEHPTIPDFYTREQRERYLGRFPFLIALPVAAIIIGMLWLVLLGDWAEQQGERAELGLVAAFLLIIAGAVTVLVWASLRKGKYEIKAWNKQHNPSPEAEARQKKAGWVCGAIMIVATVIYMIVGFGTMAASGEYGDSWGWRWGWIVYPIGGVLCALASHLIEKEEE